MAKKAAPTTANGNGHTTNGAPPPPRPTFSESQFEKLYPLIRNAFTSRADLRRKLFDPRRSIDDDCGYPQEPSPEEYQRLYDRDPIAARVVEVLPSMTWKVDPVVYESEDPNVKTPFEAAVDELPSKLRGEYSCYKGAEGNPLWAYMRLADIHSRNGRYAIILLGFDDGLPLHMPVRGFVEHGSAPLGKDKDGGQTGTMYNPSVNGVYGMTVNEAVEPPNLRYLRVFPETLATISQCESNWTSPRYGQPTQYQVTFNDPVGNSSTTGDCWRGAVWWAAVSRVGSSGDGRRWQVHGRRQALQGQRRFVVRGGRGPRSVGHGDPQPDDPADGRTGRDAV